MTLTDCDCGSQSVSSPISCYYADIENELKPLRIQIPRNSPESKPIFVYYTPNGTFFASSEGNSLTRIPSQTHLTIDPLVRYHRQRTRDACKLRVLVASISIRIHG